MRKLTGAIACLAILCMILASPVAVSAKYIAHLEVTVAPNATYQDPLDMQKGEILSCA